VLSLQHKEALSKQSAIDLVASFTHNIEAALTHSKEVTIFTLDMQEAFDALLKKQLLKRITKQGWPLSLL
jgi:outer membrane lipopolysaccharide assembly protein LptE/RlpB